jgi:hypothetical protein
MFQLLIFSVYTVRQNKENIQGAWLLDFQKNNVSAENF